MAIVDALGFRFRTLTAFNDNGSFLYNSNYTSFAELNLLDAEGDPVDRSSWEMSADSEMGSFDPSPATNLIDGNSGTKYHSEYATADPPQPHTVTAMFAGPTSFSFFQIQNRSGGKNGSPGNCQAEVTYDGVTWSDPVFEGSVNTGEPVEGALITSPELGEAAPGGPEIESVGSDGAVYDGETGVSVVGEGFGEGNADREWSLKQGSVVIPLIETGSGTDTAATLSILDCTLDGEPGLAYGRPTMLLLEVDGEDPVEFEVEFNPKAGQLYIDLTDPLADPEDRVEADPDAEPGDQLHAFGDIDIDDPAPDGLEIFPDASAGYGVGEDEAPFYARLYDDGDKTWGAPALISVNDGTVALAGDAAAGATATAALTKFVTLIGAAVASSIATGGMTHLVGLGGDAVGGGIAAAALTTNKPVQGAAIAASVAGGGLQLQVRLGGAAFVQAIAAAQLTHLVPLEGSAAGGGTAAGNLSTSGGASLASDAVGSASAVATLSLTIHLSGNALAQAAASGSLQHIVPVAGNATATSAASGNLSHQVPLGGNATGGATATGGLSVNVRLSGNAVALSSATGELAGSASLASNAVGGATAGATLTLAVPLSAHAVASAMATSQLSLQVHLQANAIAQAIASGSLSVGAGQALAGDALASSMGSGDLAVLKKLFGDAVAAAQAGGALTVRANILLAGNAVGGATASGTLSGGTALLPIIAIEFSRFRAREIAHTFRAREVFIRFH